MPNNPLRFRVAIASALIAATFVAATSPARAQAFPTRNITLVVPFTPGAITDLLARYVAPKLSDALGQPVVVENRPGAGGIIGAAYVAKSNPDGYTLLVASTFVVFAPLLQKQPAYDPSTAFAPITAAFQNPFVMAINPKLPYATVGEFIAWGKANPGKLNAATLGGFTDVIVAMFKRATGVDITGVPYRGGADATLSVIRGDSQVVFNPYASMQPQLSVGDLKMLAVTSLKRSPSTPDIPTLAETGVPDFEITNVVGLLAPAATPKPVLDKLNEAVGRILASEDYRKFIFTRGNDLVDDTSAATYGAMLKEMNAKYVKVIEENHIEKH